jgi:hypothetical protein
LGWFGISSLNETAFRKALAHSECMVELTPIPSYRERGPVSMEKLVAAFSKALAHCECMVELTPIPIASLASG